MKLALFEQGAGTIRPAVIVDDGIVDVGDVAPTMDAIIDSGTDVSL